MRRVFKNLKSLLIQKGGAVGEKEFNRQGKCPLTFHGTDTYGFQDGKACLGTACICYFFTGKMEGCSALGWERVVNKDYKVQEVSHDR
jgi:hypothetical protein